MSLPRMMVRPLKAAKPATTSAMLARSHTTVIRGSSARGARVRSLAGKLDFRRTARGGLRSRGTGRGIVGRPREEALVGAERHPDRVGDALEVVVLGAVELHDDPDDVGLELGGSGCSSRHPG